MALTKAANQPNIALQTPYIVIDGQVIELGKSATLSTLYLKNGNPISFDLNSSAKFTTQVLESVSVNAAAASGTINYDVLLNKNVLYFTSNATSNWTLNVRGSSSLSINSLMDIGQSITIVFMVTNGATAYYQTGFQIDGISVTPKWQGGTAPSSGSASSIDIYTITIIKTASNTFTALEQVSKFA